MVSSSPLHTEFVPLTADVLLWPLNIFLWPLKKALTWVLSNIVGGFIRLIEWLFSGEITAELLGVGNGWENPADASVMPGLNALYQDMVIVFFILLPIMILMTVGARMFFPNSERITYTRLASKMMAAILLVVVGEYMWFVIFELYNEVGTAIWQAGGGPGMNMDLAWFREGFVAGIQESSLGIAAIAVVLLFFIYFGTSILVTLVIFWVVLGIRLVFINTVFVLHPLLVALWVPIGGLGQYTNQIAQSIASLGALMLGLGIVIAGVLSVGGVIAGNPGGIGVEAGDASTPSPGPPLDGEPTPSPDYEFEFGGQPDASQSPAAQRELQAASLQDMFADTLSEFIFSMSAWLGTMWGVIAGIVSVFGRIMGGMGSSVASGSSTGSDSSTGDGSSTGSGSSTYRGKAARAGGRARRAFGSTVEWAGGAFSSGGQSAGSSSQATTTSTAGSTTSTAGSTTSTTGSTTSPGRTTSLTQPPQSSGPSSQSTTTSSAGASSSPQSQAATTLVPGAQDTPDQAPDAQDIPDTAPDAQDAPDTAPDAQDAPDTAPDAQDAPDTAPDAQDTSEQSPNAVERLGSTIKQTSVTDAIGQSRPAQWVNKKSAQSKQLHRSLKGGRADLPDPEDELTDAELDLMPDSEVEPNTRNELLFDGLTDEDVQSLTENAPEQVQTVEEFEWDDAVWTDEDGFRRTGMSNLDSDEFTATKLEHLKQEVRHDDYETAIDRKQQLLDISDRLEQDDGPLYDSGGNPVSPATPGDELTHARRQRIEANLAEADVTDEDVENAIGTDADTIDQLDVDELAELEQEANAGPHQKTTTETGYTYAATVGDAASSAARVYANTFMTRNGVDGWKHLVGKARQSDYLSGQYTLDSNSDGNSSGSQQRRGHTDFGSRVDPSSLSDRGAEALQQDWQRSWVESSDANSRTSNRINLTGTDDDEFISAPLPSEDNAQQKQARLRSFDLDYRDKVEQKKEELGTDTLSRDQLPQIEPDIDPEQHGHGKDQPGHTMLINPDNNPELDSPRVMELRQVSTADGNNQSEAVRYYDPTKDGAAPKGTERFSQARNVGLREYPNDVGLTDSGTPYRSLHGSRLNTSGNSTPSPEQVADYTQLEFTEHTEFANRTEESTTGFDQS